MPRDVEARSARPGRTFPLHGGRPGQDRPATAWTPRQNAVAQAEVIIENPAPISCTGWAIGSWCRRYGRCAIRRSARAGRGGTRARRLAKGRRSRKSVMENFPTRSPTSSFILYAQRALLTRAKTIASSSNNRGAALPDPTPGMSPASRQARATREQARGNTGCLAGGATRDLDTTEAHPRARGSRSRRWSSFTAGRRDEQNLENGAADGGRSVHARVRRHEIKQKRERLAGRSSGIAAALAPADPNDGAASFSKCAPARRRTSRPCSQGDCFACSTRPLRGKERLAG